MSAEEQKNALTFRLPYLAQAVQLCQVLSGTENKAFRAAALWGLGSLVCETTDLQNFIAGGAIIMEQIFSDAVDADESLQSCAAYTLACLWSEPIVYKKTFRGASQLS